MSKTYIQRPVESVELVALAALARSEEEEFFQRNPHAVEHYRDRLIAVALCQGAALQYLSRGHGVNDFDVHFFYRQNRAKPRLSRAVKRVLTNVGRFSNVPVDFIRTVVPADLSERYFDPITLLREFLRRRATANAAHLADQAVIGLAPRELYDVVVWPELTETEVGASD